MSDTYGPKGQWRAFPPSILSPEKRNPGSRPPPPGRVSPFPTAMSINGCFRVVHATSKYKRISISAKRALRSSLTVYLQLGPLTRKHFHTIARLFHAAERTSTCKIFERVGLCAFISPSTPQPIPSLYYSNLKLLHNGLVSSDGRIALSHIGKPNPKSTVVVAPQTSLPAPPGKKKSPGSTSPRKDTRLIQETHQRASSLPLQL